VTDVRRSALSTRAAMLFCVVGALAACSNPAGSATLTPTAATSASATATPSPTPSPSATFDKLAFPLDDPTSIWLIVNKTFPLVPKDWVPTDLVAMPGIPEGSDQKMRADAASALTALYDAANAAGAGFKVSTAYRSYAFQKALYDPRAKSRGVAGADRTTARPGFSEHQTGLAVDIYTTEACHLDPCFGATVAGQYVAGHAWEYGLILRYPEGKDGVTGYIGEPWHLRYVGIELSTAMHESGITTLEEFFGLPAAPDYAASP
jgi:D-alanyl-D-alanine carboxypeptidase